MGLSAFDRPLLNFPFDYVIDQDDHVDTSLIPDRWHDWKKSAVYTLFKASSSFVSFFTRSLPLYLPLLKSRFVLMAGEPMDNSSNERWTIKSMRDELDLSRTRGGRDRYARNFSPERMLKYHDDQQAHITDSMVQMASMLKAQSAEANHIIRRDIKLLNSSKSATETNADALKIASDRLASCTKDNTNWCLIILVSVVFMIFINMVIFIKFMKKN